MHKALLSCLILIFCIFSCMGDDGPKPYLIKVDGKYGFINNKGDIIIKPKYDYVLSFSEGLAAVMTGDMWGYIDHQGIFRIKPIYKYALSFKEGRALVGTLVGESYIDYSGNILFSSNKKQGFERFQEGRAAAVMLSAKFDDWRWGVVDNSGKMIVDFKYENCVFTGAGYGPNPANNPYLPYVFLDGRLPVCLNGKFGFIDINGKQIAECIYDNVRYFQFGLTVVELKGKSRLLDKSGKYVLPPEFDKIGQVTDSFIAVNKNSKWGFVDHTGTMVIPYQYDSAESFLAERAKIGVKGIDGKIKYGYIDKNGKQVIKPIYDIAYTFDSKGYAIIEIENKSGVIEKNGNYAIQLMENIKFESLEGYKNGDVLKLYYRDYVNDGIIIYYDSQTNLKGFMSVDGKKLTEPIYYDVEHFEDGVAKVVLLKGRFDFEGKKIGYIDMNGKYIWEPTI